jgi:hypothetical protein
MFVVSNMNYIAGGMFQFYKPLASAFRILFYHQGANISLFNQLGVEDEIQMVSTANEFDQKNILPFLGLLGLTIESENATYFPKGIPSEFRTLKFEKWWTEEIVINDSEKQRWTRKDLIAFAANQDGGSHVDPGIDKKYYQLAYLNSIGIKFFQGKDTKGKNLENPIPACLWQIGLEFLETMKIFRRKNPLI